jgi:hypothetical protein
MLKRRTAFTCFLTDGRSALSTMPPNERSVAPPSAAKTEFDRGGERAAAIYILIIIAQTQRR